MSWDIVSDVRFTCIGFGSRGDITPLVTLAARLRKAGHVVRIVTHPEFAGMVRNQGLEFAPVPGSYQDFLSTREGRRALGIPKNSPLGCLGLYEPFRHCATDVFAGSWEASADADGLICNGLGMAPAGMIAARRQVPIVVALVVPIVPNGHAPHPAMPPWPLGSVYNRLTYAIAKRLIARGAAPVIRNWETAAQRLGGAGVLAAGAGQSPDPGELGHRAVERGVARNGSGHRILVPACRLGRRADGGPADIHGAGAAPARLWLRQHE